MRDTKYKLVFTTGWNQTYYSCLDYVLKELNNRQAAESLLIDIESTLKVIADAAESFLLCENEVLRSRGLYKKHLLKHSYKIFYTVDGDKVYVQMILHDKQDFENLLK